MVLLMNEKFFLGTSESPIGGVEVIAGENGLCFVNLSGSKFVSRVASNQQNSPLAQSIGLQALAQILEYLSGKRQSFDVPLDWSSTTPFQKRVLAEACKIPFGEVRTYGQIADAIGQSNASRAAGAALGRNPMPILIPCHRVLAANGHLTGFSAADGILTKQKLLELEGNTVVNQKLV